ncbi:hypothetical protein MXB_437, partial [Myxobolus squamalis]
MAFKIVNSTTDVFFSNSQHHQIPTNPVDSAFRRQRTNTRCLILDVQGKEIKINIIPGLPRIALLHKIRYMEISSTPSTLEEVTSLDDSGIKHLLILKNNQIRVRYMNGNMEYIGYTLYIINSNNTESESTINTSDILINYFDSSNSLDKIENIVSRNQSVQEYHIILAQVNTMNIICLVKDH